MSYFNHAFKKTFLATKATQTLSGTPGQANGRVAVTAGIIKTAGIHSQYLKSTTAAEGYQLGPGTVGLFDASTDLSILGAGIASGCKTFYIGAASLKLNDKQGPFHGGYQETTRSKVINPKYISKIYKVTGNAASPAVLEVGGTVANNDGAFETVATTNTLVAGTGYSNGTAVATTGGTGTGLTVNVTQVAGGVTVVVINNGGTGYTVGDTITITGGGGNATFKVATITEHAGCIKSFLCGETYYLRVDVKGTPSLRSLHHNAYQTVQADGGCCADPSAPAAVDPVVIYKQWAERIAENNYLKPFVRPLLVVNGQSYAYDATAAVAEGLDPATKLFANAPTTSHTAGIVLKGAFAETQFGTCTFQPSDYYAVEPLQIYASESDINGDPCEFTGICVVEKCPGKQANGLGAEKIREMILSESYLQNFTHSDLRIREITQGDRITTLIDQSTIYSSFFIQHHVPRFSNPSGIFDNDQYLLEIVGPSTMIASLETELGAIISGSCTNNVAIADYSGTACAYSIPTV